MISKEKACIIKSIDHRCEPKFLQITKPRMASCLLWWKYFFLFLHNNHNISFIIWKWDKKLSQWSRFIFGTSSKSSTVYRRQIDFVRFVLIKSILAKPLPGSKTMKLLLKISKRNNNVIWGIWPYHTTFCYNMPIRHGSVNHMLKLRLDRKQNSNNMNIPAIPWLSCVLVAPHPETNSIYLELLKSTCQKNVPCGRLFHRMYKHSSIYSVISL